MVRATAASGVFARDERTASRKELSRAVGVVRAMA